MCDEHREAGPREVSSGPQIPTCSFAARENPQSSCLPCRAISEQDLKYPLCSVWKLLNFLLRKAQSVVTLTPVLLWSKDRQRIPPSPSFSSLKFSPPSKTQAKRDFFPNQALSPIPHLQAPRCSPWQARCLFGFPCLADGVQIPTLHLRLQNSFSSSQNPYFPRDRTPRKGHNVLYSSRLTEHLQVTKLPRGTGFPPLRANDFELTRLPIVTAHT